MDSLIHWLMQETQVWTLIQEDPICQGATEPVCQQLSSLSSKAQELQLLSPCAATTEA